MKNSSFSALSGWNISKPKKALRNFPKISERTWATVSHS